MYLIHFIILFLLVLFILFAPIPYAKAQGLPKARSGKWISVTATAYTAHETCPRGRIENCIDASGKRPIPDATLACGRNYPKGTRFQIAGRGWTCTDRTHIRYDGRIDLFLSDYQEAIKFGKQKLMIFLYEPSN